MGLIWSWEVFFFFFTIIKPPKNRQDDKTKETETDDTGSSTCRPGWTHAEKRFQPAGIMKRLYRCQIHERPVCRPPPTLVISLPPALLVPRLGSDGELNTPQRRPVALRKLLLLRRVVFGFHIMRHTFLNTPFSLNQRQEAFPKYSCQDVAALTRDALLLLRVDWGSPNGAA